MCAKAFKRLCPVCGKHVLVTKSVPIPHDREVMYRIQTVRCTGCGLQGTIEVTEKCTWIDLPKTA